MKFSHNQSNIISRENLSKGAEEWKVIKAKIRPLKKTQNKWKEPFEEWHVAVFFGLTWGEEGQRPYGLIRHDVVEATQLSKHLEARLLLSSGIWGQALPLPSIPLQLQNFDFTQVLGRGQKGIKMITNLNFFKPWVSSDLDASQFINSEMQF